VPWPCRRHPPWRRPPAPAKAASDAKDETVADAIVVSGVRASLRSAQDRKANASQIVDSIVAEDIGKLPDQNTTDALQRVTGVQIERDYGEGSTVYVRGLAQVNTTLNGREIFTAQGARPQPPGYPGRTARRAGCLQVALGQPDRRGLGGLIDAHAPAARFQGPDRRRQHPRHLFRPGQGTDSGRLGLIADRWDTGAGEIGALVSVSYQERKFRSDLISTGTWPAAPRSCRGRRWWPPTAPMT
jgi:hypothetical protein